MLIETMISLFPLSLLLILSLVVLLEDTKNKQNQIFSTLNISIALWMLCEILVDNIQNKTIGLFIVNLGIIWPTFLPILFNELITVLYYSNNEEYKEKQKKFNTICCFVSFIIITLSQTSLNISTVIDTPTKMAGYRPGVLYFVLFIYLIIGFSKCLISLFHVYKNFPDPKKYQAKYMLIGSIVTISLAIISNVICPLLGLSIAADLGPSTTIFFIGFTAYAIVRHHLFTMKIIAIEIVLFGLWTTILVRIFMAQNLHEALIEGSGLIIAITLGVLLLKSMLREILQREIIEKLNTKLEIVHENLKHINDYYNKLTDK